MRHQGSPEKVLSFDDLKSERYASWMSNSYENVTNCEITSNSKIDKIILPFHEFTVNEGLKFCLAHKKEMKMAVPEILCLWRRSFYLF